MAEKIPFLTGRVLSPDNPTAIAPGTAVASYTAAEQNAKYRTYALLAAANPAYLPSNLYRGYFFVDNTQSSQAAIISQNGVTVTTVPAGNRFEEWIPMSQIGTEEFTVTLAGTTATACIVGERSYI